MKLTLRVPLNLLKGKRDDLVMLLRLGAGINALESSARLLLKVGPGGSEVDKLSRMHSLFTGLAYFGELAKTIQHANYLDRLFELAANGREFSPMQVSLTEGRELLSPGHPDIGGNPLKRIRDQVAFHWDPHAFRALVDQSQDGLMDLWTVCGEPLDGMFTASAYAIAQFTLELPSEGRTAEEFMDTFEHAVATVGHVLQSAFIGLVIEAGEGRPQKYFVKEA